MVNASNTGSAAHLEQEIKSIEAKIAEIKNLEAKLGEYKVQYEQAKRQEFKTALAEFLDEFKLKSAQDIYNAAEILRGNKTVTEVPVVEEKKASVLDDLFENKKAEPERVVYEEKPVEAPYIEPEQRQEPASVEEEHVEESEPIMEPIHVEEDPIPNEKSQEQTIEEPKKEEKPSDGFDVDTDDDDDFDWNAFGDIDDDISSVGKKN